MVNIRIKDQQQMMGSPKGEVGEIDTRAPFQSVKAAVSLFAEVCVSKDKEIASATKKSNSCVEDVLNNEIHLVLAQREVEKYKQGFEAAEKIKAAAESELENAKASLRNLIFKLKSARELKLLAIEAAEVVKKQVKELEHLGNAARKQDLDGEHEQYTIIVSILDVAKQELTRIRQDFDAALDSKAAALQQAAEARRLAINDIQRIDELVNEIRAMKDSNQHLIISFARLQDQIAQIMAEKDDYVQACKIAKKQHDDKLISLRKQYDPNLHRDLEIKLKETNKEIEAIQAKMNRAHSLGMDTVKVITPELTAATNTLQQLVEQENSLRNTVNSLRSELEDVKKQKQELKNKEMGFQGFQVLPNGDQCTILMQKQLSIKTERARKEIADINKNVDKLKNEAENARTMVQEVKEKLEIALKNAEQAKSAKDKVYDEMRSLSEKKKAVNNDIIKIPWQEFETLKKKTEEWERLAKTKDVEAIAQVEAINARTKEAEKNLQEKLKAISEIKKEIDVALKSAEQAAAAQSKMEGELQSLQQLEHVKSSRESRESGEGGETGFRLQLPRYDWKVHFKLSRLWALKDSKFYKLWDLKDSRFFKH